MSIKNVFTDGLWKDNVIFTQLLALCPLMAVTTTATNGFGMGAVTTLVLVASNLLVSDPYSDFYTTDRRTGNAG